MKRTLTLFAALVLLAVGAAAQKLSYQAVVRNSANELVYDATVSVSLQILAADGVTVQYAETQSATTNQNGLLTLIIGEHPTGTYSLSNVNWTDASIKTEITLPTGDVVTNIMPVTAVPYALYADGTGGNLNQVQSDWTETNSASKAYIQNKPTIPTAVSQLTNDVNYITVNQVPTSISHYTNDAHYITINDVPAQVQSDWTETNSASKAYIQNKPTIPTAVSQLTNDVNYITVNQVPTSISHYTNDAHYITINDVPAQVQSDWAETNTASKAYIQNKPAIPAVPAWAMEPNKPVYNYTEIQGAPTSNSVFINDEHYITINDVPAQVQSDWAETNTASKAYIQNKPAIPAVPAWAMEPNKPVYNYTEIQGAPTSNSVFINDEHYITINDVPAQVNADWNATSGPAQILNKPTIPVVPTNVSAFNNDAGYITANQVPASISYYTNDANYITINQVPTNITYYTNDAGYLTRDSIVALQQTVNYLVTLVNSLNMRMTQEQFTVTAGQTVFNLQYAPKSDCIIRCYVNGVMVGGNHNGVLEINANNAQQVIYDASFNRNYTLKANDKVTIVYWY